MKKGILIVLGALLGIVLISNLINSAPTTRLNASSAQPTEIAQAAPSTESEQASLQSLISSCRASFNAGFPQQNDVEWQEENRAVVVSLWPDGFGAEMAEYALTDVKYLQQWNGICAGLQDISVELREQFVANGYDDVAIKINLYDPVYFDLLLASIENGEILFDAVDSTQPGERILP